ncbi:MAG: nitroreductase [Candidatus Firestonebacteria bacterium]|nr:nitroreductase [Candidatus Firestonebacteria bacterium]
MSALTVLSRPLVEVIRKRTSQRRYLPEWLAPELKRRLSQHLQALPTPPFAPACRFTLVEATVGEARAARTLGTYGAIHGARQYIVGAVTRGTRDMENYGYLLEEIVLFATDLGLGTCWLGGSFNRSGFARAMGLRDEEWLPAISPVGPVSPTRSYSDRLLRWQVRSEHRKPWNELFFHDTPGNPATETSAGAYATVLEMVRLAPSASNRQPWRILKEYNRPVFHIYLQRNPLYTAAAKTILPSGDIQRLDIGIALYHFEGAAREAGLKGRWQVLDTVPPFPKAEYVVSWNGLTAK